MIPAAHSRAHQRFLKTVLARIGIMRAIVPREPLRLRFRVPLDHFAERKFIADACVEIDALREGAAERIGNILRNAEIDVAAAGGELDPQIVLRLVINETANDARPPLGVTTPQPPPLPPPLSLLPLRLPR